MSIHDDLIEQARHLMRREPKRPRQASLRRAISAAYYAVFHLLAAEAAKSVAPSQPQALRWQVRRALGHSDMKEVCRGFAGGRISNLRRSTQRLITVPIQPELAAVASNFAKLYDVRQAADYDLSVNYSRLEVDRIIALAEHLFRDWHAIRHTGNATVFLTALLLQRHWERGAA
jgi:uncharacterized protein (UPF0332 family)